LNFFDSEDLVEAGQVERNDQRLGHDYSDEKIIANYVILNEIC
jgi:hypothetical protein